MHAREVMHGACARCGFDAPDAAAERGRCPASARWVGMCRHGVWGQWGQIGRGREWDFTYSHWAHARCDDLELWQCARLRCRRCAWEVPNFLRARAPEAEPVPPAAQLTTGTVCVVPLLTVALPAMPYFVTSSGSQRPNWVAAQQRKPHVYVRLSVFVR